MKLILNLLIFIVPLFLSAQLADKTTHDRFTDSIKKYYNSKKFDGIYNLLSPKIKKQLGEKQFSSYYNTFYYNRFGEFLRADYIDKDKDYCYYMSFFKRDTLKLIMGVNINKEIEELEFNPIRLKIATKNFNYKTDNKLISPLDSFIDSTVKDYVLNGQNCGLSIGVIQNGQTTFYNYGETKKGTGDLPTINTIYEIGSITKTFCGNLLAIAVTEKKISLEDDIRKYLPKGFKNLELNNQPILIKHLANHTSGLPRIPSNIDDQKDYDILNPYKNYTKEMLFTYLNTIALTSEPGKMCEYSNIGMALLGLILEDAYKKSFEELIIEKICYPNKMQDTKINLSATQLTNLADGHNDSGEFTNHWEFACFYAAGAIRSTTADMLKFINSNLLESDESIKLAHTTTFNSGQNMALAWHKMQRKTNKELIWHNGATGGFTSFCGFIKEKNCGFVILSNSSSRADFIGLAIYNFLQK
jgi:CubicO group peptidase (beta-lactamase class C family)